MQLERALLQEPGQSQGAERAGAAHCTDAVAGVSGARPWGRAGAQRCWHHMHGRHWGVALLRCLGVRHWTVRTRSETRGFRTRVLVSFLVLPRPNNYRGGTFMPPLRAATLQSSGPQRSLRSGDGRSDVKRGWCGCGGRDARAGRRAWSSRRCRARRSPRCARWRATARRPCARRPSPRRRAGCSGTGAPAWAQQGMRGPARAACIPWSARRGNARGAFCLHVCLLRTSFRRCEAGAGLCPRQLAPAHLMQDACCGCCKLSTTMALWPGIGRFLAFGSHDAARCA